MEFIPSSVQDLSAPGAEAEQNVLNSLKSAFGPDDTGVIYHKFPITDEAGERFDREPDFVLLSPNHGLIVVEVKGYLIEHIQRIEGQIWHLQNISQDRSRPYTQAREQAFFFQKYFLREESLRDERGNSKVPLNFIVALPNISQQEWSDRGFDELPSARVLTADDLTPQSLRSRLGDLPRSSLSDREYEQTRAAMSGGEVISGKRGRPTANPDTKSGFYEQVERGLNQLDKRQEEVGLQIPPGPQQIRGIAGSGKTVLLAMKAAAMHSKNPDWDIALTFNTRSLYDIIRSHARRFYTHFTEEEPDWGRLDVLHAWGGSSEHGLYYKIAQKAGVAPNDVDTAKRKFGKGSPSELLAHSCDELRQSADIQGDYDAILIDEAQDLEPPFFQMCYDALRPPKRLIWAYDEAQNLTSLTAPTPKSIFGTTDGGDLVVDLRGSYEGGILKSQIMRRSYRAPKSLLMTAHVFGMGLKRQEGPIQAITQRSDWEDIGYEVIEGDFRDRSGTIQITRPDRNSPHPLEGSTDAKPFIRFEQFSEKTDELRYVVENIQRDIEQEGLNPEKIMVVLLGSPIEARETGEDIRDLLSDEGIQGNCVWEGDSSVFATDGEVTLTGINRAKGNEAAMVYVVDLETIEESDWYTSPIQARNAAFVAMTRSRGWCTITGSGDSIPAFDELSDIIDEATSMNPIIEFPTPMGTEESPYSDDSIATTIDQFTGEIDPRIANMEVECPVDSCGFSGSPPLIARHVSGTSDFDHSWTSIGFEGPQEFLEQYD